MSVSSSYLQNHLMEFNITRCEIGIDTEYALSHCYECQDIFISTYIYVRYQMSVMLSDMYIQNYKCLLVWYIPHFFYSTEKLLNLWLQFIILRIPDPGYLYYILPWHLVSTSLFELGSCSLCILFIVLFLLHSSCHTDISLVRLFLL